MSALGQMDPETIADYQPYWALKADLLQRLGSNPRATVEAYAKAIGLIEDSAVRRYLVEKSVWPGFCHEAPRDRLKIRSGESTAVAFEK